MRLLLRRGVTVLAIYAVALHVILLGLVPIAANGEIVNPFSVICHSAGPAAAGDETPGKPDLIPGHACEHCNLCSAAPPPEPAVVLDRQSSADAPVAGAAPGIAYAVRRRRLPPQSRPRSSAFRLTCGRLSAAIAHPCLSESE